MIEPTENERRELNARLARAMGWTAVEPPDFTRDPAASRELVVWLAEQDYATWGQFSAFLLDAQMTLEVQECGNWEDVTRAALTASPLLIAQAADAAIGETP